MKKTNKKRTGGGKNINNNNVFQYMTTPSPLRKDIGEETQ
jgi:hypothetical protein